MRPGGSVAVALETGAAPARAGAPLHGPTRDRIAAALEAVRVAVPGSGSAGDGELAGAAAARTALSSAWDRVMAEVGSGRGAAADLLPLLTAIKEAESALTLDSMRRREAAFGRVRDALAELRECDSTSSLIERAAASVCSVGFDRAIVSRIEDSSWITERVWVERDAKWASEILETGRANPQVLDRTLVETEMVRRKVGILVHDVQDRPAVNRPIADVSLSRSYVAVPLLSGGSVIGFVHCDCYYQERELDSFDRQLLTVFAEGLGQALGRTAMLDRLTAIRAGFDQVSTALLAARADQVQLGGPGAEAPGPRFAPAVATQPAFAPGGYDDRFPTPTDGGTLTRREVEVLRLMAAGDTNGRIARRLVISEGTVKSHVKHILRKLGAANRAEAVSRWLGMEHERGGRPGTRRDG
jgi:DNA-binding CsgD family transcriptional regulator/GAF domain-containing protein